VAPEAAHEPFDSTLKEMADRRPRPWMGLQLGLPVDDVQFFNADLSTIIAEADKLFRIGGPRPWIVHTEFERWPSNVGSSIMGRVAGSR
jgi:hypothetical protein